MAKTDLTAERLRELLYYDPDTGVFTWRAKTNRRIPVGIVAGTIHRLGYVIIQLCGKRHFAHRLAWMYAYGTFPSKHIDHINGDGRDNRITNLREATQAENMQNRRKSSRNKSGFLGVCAVGSRWKAQIQVHGKHKNLGLFETPESAHAAYASAKKKMHAFNPTLRA